jgi:membrane-associated phospholipid phosphatase
LPATRWTAQPVHTREAPSSLLLNRSHFVRPCSFAAAAASFALLATTAGAQAIDTTTHDKTFLTRRDLLVSGLAVGATALLSIYDDDIAKASQQARWQDSSKHRFAIRVSKVNETTLTVAGLVAYGIGRLSGNRTVTDVALHATESVVLASLASQVIRGPLGRARPYVTKDTDQYNFSFMGGFKRGEPGFQRRAFPSIHTSSSMAMATVLTMELHRRRPGATPFVAPVLFIAGLLPGLVRIQLDQHWATDVAAGAFMGVFAGYKVVSYSHDHPNNVFDRTLLKMSVAPDPHGGMRVAFSPF